MRNYEKKSNLRKVFKRAVGTMVGVAVLSTSTVALASNFTTAALSNPNLVGEVNLSKGKVAKYGATGALEFYHNNWIVIKQNKSGGCGTIIKDQYGEKTYSKGVLGHANDMTVFNDTLLVATAGDKNAKSDAPIKGIEITCSKENGHEKFEYGNAIAYYLDEKIKKIGDEIGGIAYIGKENVENKGKQNIFVLKNNRKKKIIRAYLDTNAKKFCYISDCSITNPRPCMKNNASKEDTNASVIGQGISYDATSKTLYMGYGVTPSNDSNDECDNRMLIGKLSYSTVKNKSTAKVTSYINKAKAKYTKFEVECIAFDNNGTMYFDTNGVQDGEQLDKIVAVYED